MNDREKLIELLKDSPSLDAMDNDGYAMGADHLISHGVTVRERGRWEIYDDGCGCELMSCSVCRAEFYDGDNDTVDQMHNFCPNCGAKMDGERRTDES